MFKSEFERVSRLYKGTYRVNESQTLGKGFSSMSVSHHKLEIPFGDRKVTVIYELGNINLATFVETQLKVNPSNLFKLQKVGHLKLMVSTDKTSLKVISENEIVKKAISELLVRSGMSKLADNSLFDPKIEFLENEGLTSIKTSFYLGFEGKEESILSLIRFYEDLIPILTEKINI